LSDVVRRAEFHFDGGRGRLFGRRWEGPTPRREVVLVHGYGEHSGRYEHVGGFLAARGARVHAYDHQGHGRSSGLRCHVRRFGDFLDDLDRVVGRARDASQGRPVFVIGHSMGGVIIAYASLAAPARADTLVLVEPGFYMETIPAFLNYLFFPLDRIMARQFYTRGMRERFFMGSFYNKSLVTDEVIDAYMLPTRTPNALEAMARMMSTVGVKNYEGVTEKITRPTLIVWGERGPEDPLTFATRIKGEIPESQLITVKECGHYVQEEKPQELATIIKEYLR